MPEAVPEVHGIYAPAPKCPEGEYRRYSAVPWHRRSGANVLLVLLGVLFPPLLWWAVGNSLTGRIYTPHRDETGYLEKWCPVSKFAAAIVLVFQTTVVALAIPAIVSGRITPDGPATPSAVDGPGVAKTPANAGGAVSQKPADNTAAAPLAD